MVSRATSAPCPCGRLSTQKKPLAYVACCGRYLNHFADTPAPDAESLMRSRYSAFVMQRADYLLATWHVGFRPGSVEFDPDVKWLGLEVRGHTLIDATHAEVEFIARQKPAAGKALRLHERSRFTRENDRWYYLDGDMG